MMDVGTGVVLGYLIREFRERDLSKVIEINLKCLPEHYPSFFYLDLYRRYPKSFLVAVDERGEVVGYVMCRVEGNILKSLFGREERRGHIISIAVLPEHRRKGVGRSLMMRALNALREVYGCNSCFLEVRVSNSTAINLYRELGFKITKSIAGYYRDGESAYVMELKF